MVDIRFCCTSESQLIIDIGQLFNSCCISHPRRLPANRRHRSLTFWADLSHDNSWWLVEVKFCCTSMSRQLPLSIGISRQSAITIYNASYYRRNWPGTRGFVAPLKTSTIAYEWPASTWCFRFVARLSPDQHNHLAVFGGLPSLSLYVCYKLYHGRLLDVGRRLKPLVYLCPDNSHHRSAPLFIELWHLSLLLRAICRQLQAIREGLLLHWHGDNRSLGVAVKFCQC